MNAARRETIVITGSEGVVGTVLRAGLAEAYALRCLTRTPQPFASEVADITDEVRLREVFAGADAVIHLAGAITLQAGWDDVLTHNMQGTRNVFAAAKCAGAPAVIYASSGHVLGGVEQRAGAGLYELGDTRQFDETTPPEPDTLYGVSKLYGETLGRHYARHEGMRVISIRIGMVLPGDDPRTREAGRGRSSAMTPEERYPRMRAKWLSHRDCCQLFLCALAAKHVADAVVFGTSNNPRQIWSLRGAREMLGYEPRDAAPAAYGDGGRGEEVRV